jgi:anti-sigma regulatory factor (Ser/Thr protein kinase)
VSDVSRPEDRARRVVLLMSERVLNAVKPGGDGELRIAVTLDEAPDGSLRLEVANDGRSDVRVARRVRIADALARSLGAELHFTGGAWCVAPVWLPRG